MERVSCPQVPCACPIALWEGMRLPLDPGDLVSAPAGPWKARLTACYSGSCLRPRRSSRSCQGTSSSS